jgi:hypothetical protein
VEDTFKRIQSHKGVEGIIVISNDGIPIRTTLDPEITVQYAALVTRFTEKSRSVLAQVNGQVSERKRSEKRRGGGEGGGSDRLSLLSACPFGFVTKSCGYISFH